MQTPSPDDRQFDPVSGAEILPGDIIDWSDLDETATPTAIGMVLARLIGQRHPERVLLVGAQAASLLETIPASCQVDVLVRGRVDGETLSARMATRVGGSLYCGAIDRFADDEGYDLVVALGGPSMLASPDTGGIGERELLGRLAELVRDGGCLVAGVENGLGLDSFLATKRTLAGTPAGWHLGATGFDARPLFERELDEALAERGLAGAALMSVYPSASRPVLVLRQEAFDDPALLPTTRRLLVEVLTEHFSHTEALQSPSSVADRVALAGQGRALAPLWLVIAAKGGSAVELGDIPAITRVEESLAAAWGQAVEVSTAGEAASRWVTPAERSETSEAQLSRALVAPAIAPGLTLEHHLREACASLSHQRVRELVQRYQQWLSDDAIWDEDSSSRFFATPDNVVVADDGSLEMVDRSWQLAQPVPAAVGLVRGLRRFAKRLLGSAGTHPWRPTSSPDSLTQTLAAMAGLTVSPDMLTTVGTAEGLLAAVLNGQPHEAERYSRANLKEAASDRHFPAADQTGYRELVARDRATALELRELGGRIGWLEGTLRHRDRRIHELEQELERYAESASYKAYSALSAPRRLAVSKARGAAKEAIGPGNIKRARQLAKSMEQRAANTGVAASLERRGPRGQA
ncbi:MAG: hypothetical protein LWW86_12575 [Micrococcales bacterium]|nr:hypothetical protein [Micrococcales bacterium]